MEIRVEYKGSPRRLRWTWENFKDSMKSAGVKADIEVWGLLNDLQEAVVKAIVEYESSDDFLRVEESRRRFYEENPDLVPFIRDKGEFDYAGLAASEADMAAGMLARSESEGYDGARGPVTPEGKP